MRKILFVLPFFPFPMTTGGHQALFNGIFAVKDKYDIYLVFKVTNIEEYQKVKQSFENRIPSAHLFPWFLKTMKPSKKRIFIWETKKIIKKLLGIKSPTPISTDPAQKLYSEWLNSILPLHREWLEHVGKVCQQIQFDIIQVEMPWMISQILTLPVQPKKIFVHHELGFVRRGLEVENLKQNEYLKAYKKFVDINEITMLNMYDMVITLSSVDRAKLIEKGVSVPVSTSMAIVDTLPIPQYEGCDGKRLVFLGFSRHVPNFVGITWFLEQCWKVILRYDRSYSLDIIGKWDEKLQEEYRHKYPNINFLGFVDNLVETMRGAIMIVPITIGSGIRMKILEACSAGVPFVSTSVGAEGIPVINGEHCFIADDVNDFVEDIIKLQDVDLQRKFVKNANKLVQDKYSIDSLRKNRLNIYNELMDFNGLA